jgi:hypothetical protein
VLNDSAFRAFSAAAARLPQPPSDVPELFAAWLKQRRPGRRIPKVTLSYLVGRYRGYVTVTVFGGVAGILSSDRLVAFVDAESLYPAWGVTANLDALRFALLAGALAEPILLPDAANVEANLSGGTT